MNPSQVGGLDGLLSVWERDHAGMDRRWLAYALATTFHETARTMQPIEEYGKGRGHKYGLPMPPHGLVYYGRGFVQLTWDFNYRTLGDRIGVDLIGNPALAMVPETAAKILFTGMIEGLFSRKKLGDYFAPTIEDWVGARHIINGQDRADAIAGYGKAFVHCLAAA